MVTARDSGLCWRSSSISGGGNCIEVAFTGADHVLVRDSKLIDGPVLEFTREEWRAFLGGVKLGEFDV